MDCEKFDQHVIDELYGELDEVTHAALERHVAGCSRCAGILAGLRATRAVAVLPLVEPPASLDARILDLLDGPSSGTSETSKPAEAAVAAVAPPAAPAVPMAGKVLRFFVRPQFAMAAAFLLLVGSSLWLLQGSAKRAESVAVADRAAAPAAAAPAAAEAPAATATAAAVAIGGEPAPAPLEEKHAMATAAPTASAAPSLDEAREALAEARSVRDSAGCTEAVNRLEGVASRFSGTPAADDAAWDAADCYKQMGDQGKAQQLYAELGARGYRRGGPQQQVAARAAAGPPAAKPAAEPAAAAPAGTAAVAAAESKAKAKAADTAAAGATNPRAPAAPMPAPARAAKPASNVGFAP